MWRVEPVLVRIRQMLTEAPEGGEFAHSLLMVGQGAGRLRQA